MVLILRKQSPHAGPRPETSYRLDRTRTNSQLKVRAQGRRKKVKVFLLNHGENIAVVLLLAALCTFLFIIASKSAVHREENISLTLIEAEDEDDYVQQPLPTSYQCALVWLRVPKTATTTVSKYSFSRKRHSFLQRPPHVILFYMRYIYFATGHSQIHDSVCQGC